MKITKQNGMDFGREINRGNNISYWLTPFFNLSKFMYSIILALFILSGVTLIFFK